MTDTDLFDEEDTVDFDTDVDEDEELDDLEFDFEHLTPDAGAYEAKILSVGYRSYDNEKTGRHVIGLQIRLQLQEDAGEFDGTFITHFLYIGEDKPKADGKIKMKAFFEAAGHGDLASGNMKVSQWEPVWRQIGKTRERCLSIFDDIVVGVNLDTEEKVINGESRVQIVVKSFMDLDTLATVKAEAANVPTF